MDNTSKNKNNNQETFIVPADVILEVAQIILQADLLHEIIGVNENKRQIIIGIGYQNNLKFHQEAVKNIAGILKEYHELCSSESETVNWRES